MGPGFKWDAHPYLNDDGNNFARNVVLTLGQRAVGF